MRVLLTSWHQDETCTWCESDRECVTADFGDGFIRNAPLCWKCLQKAMRVRQRQEEADAISVVAAENEIRTA